MVPAPCQHRIANLAPIQLGAGTYARLCAKRTKEFPARCWRRLKTTPRRIVIETVMKRHHANVIFEARRREAVTMPLLRRIKYAKLAQNYIWCWIGAGFMLPEK